jgi:RAT1-interacting protein
MDFSEQDVDVFGEEYGAEAEAEGGGGGGASSGSSSPSSSSSSSAAASSSSSSGGASSAPSSSGAGGGGDEEGADEGEYDSLPTRAAAGFRDEDDEEEEARDLFGSDNEDYVKTPARSNYLVPGSHLVTSTLRQIRLGEIATSVFDKQNWLADCCVTLLNLLDWLVCGVSGCLLLGL